MPSTSQLLEFFSVHLATNSCDVTVWIELDMWVIQIIVMDTRAAPTIGPRGKITTREAHPISVHTTTNRTWRKNTLVNSKKQAAVSTLIQCHARAH